MPVTNLLKMIQDGSARGERMAVVRVLSGDSGRNATMTVCNGELFPPLADRKLAKHILAATESLEAKGGVVDLVDGLDEKGSPVSVVIEIIKPKVGLVIFGAGHVGQALALMAALTGYDVTVVDDREEFASRERLPSPGIGLLVSDYASAVEKLVISSNTAVVIVTRGHQYDELCLKSVVRSDAAYLGMIGSRRRVLSVFKKLIGEGFSEADLLRVHAPIGLRIGARSPQEIAVAILAEIIDHLNNPEQKHKGERNGI
jgi:xanthine dehydrogenase accessory factor